MSKSDQKQAKQQANDQISKNNANTTATNDQLQDVLGTAKSTAASVLPGITAGYSDIASTGGYDPSILGRVNESYTNLATTGGFSPDQINSAYTRSSDAARSAYKAAEDQATRTASATGGYGNPSAAILGDLTRKESEASERATTGVTAALAPTIQAGEIAGTKGLADTQQSIASNKLSALGGSTNIYGLNESQVNQTVDAILRNYQVNGQLNNQDLDMLTKLANQPGVFDKIVGTIGTLGGAAAGVMGAVNSGKK